MSLILYFHLKKLVLHNSCHSERNSGLGLYPDPFQGLKGGKMATKYILSDK